MKRKSFGEKEFLLVLLSGACFILLVKNIQTAKDVNAARLRTGPSCFDSFQYDAKAALASLAVMSSVDMSLSV